MMTNVTKISFEQFERLIQQTGVVLKSNDKVAVAVSGGADSLALTFLLSQFSKKYKLSLIALTIDHQLRKESQDESNYVRTLLHTNGIIHKILKWNGDKPVTKIQETARIKRYNLLENWCLNNDCKYLFLGHHLDDQIETFLLRLRKKSGILGLAGMRTVTKKQRCTIIRPFLKTSKSYLVNTLSYLKINHINDPSNENKKYERVFWRNSALNKQEIYKNIQCIYNVRKYTEQWVNKYLYNNAYLNALGFLTIDQESFLCLPFAFQEIILSYILRGIGVTKYPSRRSSLVNVINQMKEFKVITIGGLQIISQKKKYLFIREYRKINNSINLNLMQNKQCIWDSRFIINNCHRKAGIVKSLGKNGWEQLIIHYPQLSKIGLYKPALWSTPAVWVGDKIKEEDNIIFQHFIQKECVNNNKMYIFSHKFPFHTLFFC